MAFAVLALFAGTGARGGAVAQEDWVAQRRLLVGELDLEVIVSTSLRLSKAHTEMYTERLLALAHQARVRMFEGLGATELDLGDGETGIVAADVAVAYLSEAFLNDVLVFELKPVEIGLVAFRLAHRVAHKGTGKKVALIEIGFVGFDTRRRAPGRLPEPFVAALKAMDGASGN